MMARVERVEVDAGVARSRLDLMLLGSYLDSLNVSSLQVSLRFINSRVHPGESLYVELSFSCSASIRERNALNDSLAQADFFVGRASFLAGVYARMGIEISNIELDSTGRLLLFMDGSLIELIASEEDMEAEGSIWQVAIEISAGSALSSGNSISCVSTGSDVIFLSDVER